MAAKRPNRRRPRSPWVRRVKRAAVFLGITFGIALSAGLAVYIPIYQEASDDVANIERRLVVENSDPTVVLSSDGRVLYSAAAIRRKVIKLSDVPPYVGYALVAAEDRRFYDHHGVDPIGLLRVAFTTVRERRSTGGASTIPMQMAKQMVNGDARTAMRKLRDIATAQQIENLKSKAEILDIYANNTYFGEQAYGIERAAQVYFGKHASELTVGEAAMLARCVRLPSRINPVKSPEKMIELRDYVLKVMLDEGWITQSQYEEGIHEVPKLKTNSIYNPPRYAAGCEYFVNDVLARFRDRYPGVDYSLGGYTIQTSLNYKLQMKAVQAVKDVLRENRGHKVNDGAIVVMDQYGRILAEVGGADYNKQQFNVVTHGRQPGSAFKAIVYATALRNDVIRPGQQLSNATVHWPGDPKWNPQNASPRENRPTYSLENAFAYSINRPAIHTIIDTDPAVVAQAAKDVFGIQSPVMAVPSLALGTSDVKPIEMLEAYSVFMLGGNRAHPQPIMTVKRSGDEKPDIFEPHIVQNVLDPRIAQQMDEILKTPVNYPGGTGQLARDVPNARGKTGTTNDAKDAWFCGYSDGLVGVGWVGHSGPKGEALKMSSSVFGGTVTVKIWRSVMLAAHNLGLAKGVQSSGSTSVTVSSSPEPEVKPVSDEEPKGPKRPINPPIPGDGPVLEPAPHEPDPASNPDKPPIGVGDDWDPTKEPPIDPDKVKVDPDEPKTDPKPRPSKRDPKRSEQATEEVEVCVDTDMKAGMYCPETVTKTFPKGRGPRKICTLHHG